ncbi:MAG: acyltransferase family protein [Bacteroidales bacterium]|nr:acyltransferase family protein [Bacteroidales bacterium]
MILWYLLILILSLVNVRFCKNGFFPDYLGKEQSNAIKGVFILLVFLGHALIDLKHCGFSFDQKMDLYAWSIHLEMGQLVVAMFLFYSGYGVMKSLMVRGNSYFERYPKHRLLSTLLNFDVAVCFFMLLALIMGERLSFSRILLSFIGWQSVGNSNWYIFVILCCYLAFYLVFKVVGNRYGLGIVLLSLITLGGMMVLYEFKPPHWYNTMLVFPCGCAYATYSEKLEQCIQKRYGLVIALLIVAFLSLHFLMKMHPLHGLTFNVKSIVFALLTVALTMKVQIGNRWILWCGFSLFPLYIYQRLPMNAIQNCVGDNMVSAYPNLFICVCFFVTLGIALLYNKYLKIDLA